MRYVLTLDKNMKIDTPVGGIHYNDKIRGVIRENLPQGQQSDWNKVVYFKDYDEAIHSDYFKHNNVRVIWKCSLDDIFEAPTEIKFRNINNYRVVRDLIDYNSFCEIAFVKPVELWSKNVGEVCELASNFGFAMEQAKKIELGQPEKEFEYEHSLKKAVEKAVEQVIEPVKKENRVLSQNDFTAALVITLKKLFAEQGIVPDDDMMNQIADFIKKTLAKKGITFNENVGIPDPVQYEVHEPTSMEASRMYRQREAESLFTPEESGDDLQLE